MRKNIFAVIAAICCTAIFISCTNEDGARDALMGVGLHPISIGGYAPYRCGEGTVYATEFVAYNPDSTRIVKGCVCESMMKGKTIVYN